MAKGKHSTALFEVIHSSKRFENKEARDGIMRTPKWWFKGRGQANAARTVSGAATSPGATAAVDPTDPTSAVATATSAAPADPFAAAPAAEPNDLFDPTAAPVAPEPVPEKDIPPLSGRAGIRVALDPDRHEVMLRVRYTTAVVTAFTVLVVVALAYLTGRHTG